jgi:hypothetical protein
MEQNRQSELAREKAYKDKFSRFEENMNRKLDWYQQNVSQPKANFDRLQSERQRLIVESAH